ncbi:MAG: T9SS type A sorting domain-containing protein [Candidatus Edwardsbacteria bacterium]
MRSVVWDSRDESGKQVSAGVYFYRLTAGDFADTKKMIVLR